MVIAGVGAAFMALRTFRLWASPDVTFFGTRIYDLYFLALINGRFDLPMRELRYEGHYAPDGTGYLYHGLGPLINRLPFAPFVDFPTTWLAPLSILFWALVGNICYHRAFVVALDQVRIADRGAPPFAYLLLALAVWFVSPGLYLAGSISLFFEPISMAYGLGGIFVLLIVLVAFGRWRLENALVPIALVAGLALHARPHLAVGYYMATCLLAGAAFLRSGMTGKWKAVHAILVLGLFGGVLLASNFARFQDPLTMHGSFAESEVRHGTAFWGLGNTEGPRVQAFEDHGRFNAMRILPNALVYFASPPERVGLDAGIERIEALHRAMVSLTGDYVKVERPKIGVLFLWPCWILCMAIGLRNRSLWRTPGVQGMAGVATGGLMILAYATITLRYHLDLWPLIALPAAFGIGSLVSWYCRPGAGGSPAGYAGFGLLLVGFAFSMTTARWASDWFNEDPVGYFGPWSRDFCLELTARKGFPEERGHQLCRLQTDQQLAQ